MENIDKYFEIPNFCLCPITGEIMDDPVMLITGHSYEKEAIKNWFQRGNTKDPVTGIKLTMRALHPNYQLREAIEYVKKIIPDYQKNTEKLTNINMAVERMEEIIRQRKDVSENEIDALIINNIKLLEEKDREIEELRRKTKVNFLNFESLSSQISQNFQTLKSQSQIGLPAICKGCEKTTDTYFCCRFCCYKTCFECAHIYVSDNDYNNFKKDIDEKDYVCKEELLSDNCFKSQESKKIEKIYSTVIIDNNNKTETLKTINSQYFDIQKNIFNNREVEKRKNKNIEDTQPKQLSKVNENKICQKKSIIEEYDSFLNFILTTEVPNSSTTKYCETCKKSNISHFKLKCGCVVCARCQDTQIVKNNSKLTKDVKYNHLCLKNDEIYLDNCIKCKKALIPSDYKQMYNVTYIADVIEAKKREIIKASLKK